MLVVICISRRKNERVRFEKATPKQSCKPEGKEKAALNLLYYLYYDIVIVTLGHLEIGIAKHLPARHQHKTS